MPNSSFAGVIALDGPSGTGKSTVARGLARRLGVRYLDSGAMYRAVTALVLCRGVEPTDADGVTALLAAAELQLSTDPDDQIVSIAGADVTTQIRSAEVTTAVSAVSAIAAVRTDMVDQQRALIGLRGIVVEGRDIASVVWPQAEVKIYLTAAPEVRAARRAGELSATPGRSELSAVAADLARRDRLDRTRAISPLIHADGAVELDTSDLDVHGVIDAIVAMVVASARAT